MAGPINAAGTTTEEECKEWTDGIAKYYSNIFLPELLIIYYQIATVLLISFSNRTYR